MKHSPTNARSTPSACAVESLTFSYSSDATPDADSSAANNASEPADAELDTSLTALSRLVLMRPIHACVISMNCWCASAAMSLMSRT